MKIFNSYYYYLDRTHSTRTDREWIQSNTLCFYVYKKRRMYEMEIWAR